MAAQASVAWKYLDLFNLSLIDGYLDDFLSCHNEYIFHPCKTVLYDRFLKVNLPRQICAFFNIACQMMFHQCMTASAVDENSCFLTSKCVVRLSNILQWQMKNTVRLSFSYIQSQMYFLFCKFSVYIPSFFSPWVVGLCLINF